MSDLNLFDPIAYFEDRNIDYYTEGKNVSRGWVNISCPFCDDPSWHCGVNLKSNLFHCWICDEKGSVIKLIQRIEDCSWAEAKRIFREFCDEFKIQNELPEHPRLKTRKIITFPIVNLQGVHRVFLTQRGFLPNHIIKKYKIKASTGIGKYRYRIIIPIFFNGKMVSFTARAIFDHQTPKYLNCPNNLSLVDVHDIFYNVDSLKNKRKCVIVEGVTDVWRIGEGAIAMLGKNISEKQIFLLKEKKIEEILLLFDKDAEEKAESYAKQLASLFLVNIGILDKGDPGELDDESVSKIKNWLED